MINFIYNILANKDFLLVGTNLGVIISIFVLVMFFIKTSRDERGRAIIGKASICSTIYFIVISNTIANLLQRFPSIDIYVCANSIQFIYNTVLLVEGIAIVILKKMPQM